MSERFDDERERYGYDGQKREIEDPKKVSRPRERERERASRERERASRELRESFESFERELR